MKTLCTRHLAQTEFDYLISIYRAILKLGAFFDPWREFTTLVIRKLDKPNYTVL